VSEPCRFTSGTADCVNGPLCGNVNHRGPRVLESLPADGPLVRLADRAAICASCGGGIEAKRHRVVGDLHLWCWAKLAGAAPTGTDERS